MSSPRPTLLGRGVGWVPENPEMFRCLHRRVCSCTPPDPSVHLPRPQAAASSPVSSLLLHPLGPGQQREVRSRSPERILCPWLVVMAGWRSGHPGQACHLTTLHQEIFSIYWIKVHLEERQGLCGGGQRSVGLALAPLAFPIGLCSLLSKARPRYLANPTILSRAVLTMRGAHLSPKKLAK